MIDILKNIASLLAQLVQLLSQRPEGITALPTVPNPHAGTSEPENGELFFDHARRLVLWRGGSCDLRKRKKKRYAFVAFMWDRVGEYVTGEEIAAALFDHAKYEWNSIKRYGNRVQQEDLGPTDCPFFLREEEEGFTLMRLS